ncbi:hypothetical protein HDU99_008119, partial [Rhizoclosmatium hyalinum]
SFATPAYWMMGLNAGASNFFIFITYLWLALYVAESFVVLISAMFPIFVAALTLVSFFNGLEMVTQGFFVRRDNIPAFWNAIPNQVAMAASVQFRPVWDQTLVHFLERTSSQIMDTPTIRTGKAPFVCLR